MATNSMLVSRSIPRPVLIGTGVLLICLVAWAGIARLNGAGHFPPTASILVQRDLWFEDQLDGSIAVRNAADDRVVASIHSGQDNFLRATLRGLARQRKREDAGAAVPFRLIGWADGRLTLLDSVSGRAVELEAFGATNEESFARLLTASAPNAAPNAASNPGTAP